MHTAHCTPRVYHLESHLSWASCHAAPLVQLPKEQFWMQLGHNRSQPRNNYEKQPSKKFNFSQHCEQAVTPSNTVRFHRCFSSFLTFERVWFEHRSKDTFRIQTVRSTQWTVSRSGIAEFDSVRSAAPNRVIFAAQWKFTRHLYHSLCNKRTTKTDLNIHNYNIKLM